MAQQQKIEGQLCPDCGQGKIIKNPKTGKLFCEKKCWLGTGQTTTTKYSGGKNKGDIKSIILSYGMNMTKDMIQVGLIKTAKACIETSTEIADGLIKWYKESGEKPIEKQSAAKQESEYSEFSGEPENA